MTSPVAKSSGLGLGTAVYVATRAKIVGGLFEPGRAVPSTRALAMELGVSRTTVNVAYEKLLAEGYLETRPGSGTFVPMGFRAATAPVAAGAGPGPFPASMPRFSQVGRRALDLVPQASGGVPRIDLRYGAVAAADFPVLAWRRALANVALRRRDRLPYGSPLGTVELRTALQAYLWRARGLRCDIAQVIVVNGSQQALDLCARLLVDPGDRVVLEDPCYVLARHAFMAAGAVPLPIAVDGDGMRTERLADHAGGARLAYVTPSHQFPLGSVMSVSRRQALLGWAREANGYVIEDDYDSEFRYDGRPVEAMRTLDTDDRVIYVGTLSKTLSPGLRLGYMVAPVALCDGLAALKRLADRHTPELLQEAAAELIGCGAYERHVRRLRRRNADRRTALLTAIRTHLGDRATVSGAAAGLHVVVWFRGVSRADEAALAEAAAGAGVGVNPLGPHWHGGACSLADGVAGLVLGYASLNEAQIDQGVQTLAAVLDGFAAARRRAGTA